MYRDHFQCIFLAERIYLVFVFSLGSLLRSMSPLLHGDSLSQFSFSLSFSFPLSLYLSRCIRKNSDKNSKLFNLTSGQKCSSIHNCVFHNFLCQKYYNSANYSRGVKCIYAFFLLLNKVNAIHLT